MPISAIAASRLIQLQSFRETVYGTTGVATARWMGVKPEPQFKPFFAQTPIDEQRGSVVPSFIAPLLKKGGTFKIDGVATYEDILFLLAGGMQGGVIPTGGPTYVWPFVSGSNAAWNAQTYTFELGYGAANTILANGCVVDKYSIKSDVSKPWEYSLAGFYQTHNQNVTLTPALADRTIEAILMPGTTLAIDPAGTAYGTTPYASTLLTFALDVTNGLKPVYTGGSLGPISFVYERIMVKLKLEVLYTAAIKTLLTGTIFAGTGVGIQLQATSGSKLATLQFSGNMITDLDDFANKEGSLAIPLEFEAVYDAGTPAAYLKASVSNTVATIP